MALDLSSIKKHAINGFANFLNLPALPFHVNEVLVSAAFYFTMYTFIGPWLLKNKAPFDYAKLPEARRTLWNDWTASLSQSIINTALAFYIIISQKALPATPQERMLGYDSQVESVVALATGYFVFHLYQTTKDSHLDGYLMILHAIASIVSSGLGFVSSPPPLRIPRTNNLQVTAAFRSFLYSLVLDLGTS